MRAATQITTAKYKTNKGDTLINTIIHQNKRTLNHRAAIVYALKLNWVVFPCNGKVPLTPNGFKDATKDIELINQYWARWPNANIGVPTGDKNKFFVLDIDPRHNGDQSFDELIEENGQLPDTVQALTGGGGAHYLFNYREGIGNIQNLLPGIDIKGEGGYIVVAPSLHPDTGKAYEWELSSRVIENETAEAPEWLLNMIQKPKKKSHHAKPSSYWINIFNNTSEGNRNSNAASLTGYLLRRYLDPLLVGEIVKLWNEEKVNPPLSDEELNKVFDSIAKKEMKRKGANL